MGQTTEDLQEQLNSALRRAESAEYWIERNADFLHGRAKSAEALPPERDHGLVSISEMNRRIAEAVAAEKEACAAILQEAAIKLIGGKSRVNQVDRHVAYVLTGYADKIRERGAK